MKLNKSILVFSFAFVVFAFTSCKDNRETEDRDRMERETDREARMTEENRTAERMDWEENNVFARVQDNSELRSFSQNIDSVRFADSFTDRESSYTIFAPSNEAYQNLNQQERDGMMREENRNQNTAMLHYLMVEEELTSEELREEIENSDGNYSLTTMQGEEITASLEGQNIVLKDASGNTATIIQPDNDASNGVVHIIDKMLRPSDANTNAAAGTTSRNTGNNNRTGTNQNIK